MRLIPRSWRRLASTVSGKPAIWYESRLIVIAFEIVPRLTCKSIDARRFVTTIVATTLCACSSPTPSGYQGYVEGEFVNVASPIAGRLDQLIGQAR